MPITLTTQMANGNLLFRPSTVPGAAFTQLHIDIINASPTALALYESAARNNVPVTIAAPKPDGSGGGTFYNPNPSTDGTAPNGTIVIDARDFTSQTNPAASPAANAVANALSVVSGGVHEVAHALDHLDGTPLVSRSTFSTPSAYALARSASEGNSLAAEGKVKTELLDKVFTAPGQAEAITVTRSSYYVGDPSADAHFHTLFTDTTRTAEQQTQSAREFGTQVVLDYIQSTSRLNYLAADLKAYASYWSGIPIEQITEVSIEDASQIWVVSARKGVTEIIVSFGDIDTTILPNAATQAISRLEVTPDADGNQLVKHYNYASGILTSTLSDLDGHLLNQYQIPIPTGSAGLAPSPATSPSPSPIAQASPELNSDTVGQLANFFRQTPEAATTPFTLTQNSTVILGTGTSRQIYDLATGQLTAQVDADGGGFIVRGIDNSAYYFNPGELRLDTLSGQIVPAAHSQATLDYFGAAAVAYYVSGTGSAPAQPSPTSPLSPTTSTTPWLKPSPRRRPPGQVC